MVWSIVSLYNLCCRVLFNLRVLFHFYIIWLVVWVHIKTSNLNTIIFVWSIKMCMVKKLQFVSLLVTLCFASSLEGLWANFTDFYEPLTDSLHTHVDARNTMVEMTFDKSNSMFSSRMLCMYILYNFCFVSFSFSSW